MTLLVCVASSRQPTRLLRLRAVAGGGQRITDDERERVRAFLLHLVEWSGKSWDKLVFEAGVPSATAQGWRYKAATPQAPALLDLLRSAGVLDENYELVAKEPG